MPKSTSLWIETSHRPSTSPLTRDANADVCIVGAGIAGLTTAYLLAREGASVVVIDAGAVGNGQTAVTTAHLSSVIDDTFKEMLRLHGPDGARLACESHASAIDAIQRICVDEHVDCRFERLDGYLFLGREDKESTLDEELEAARTAGARVTRLPHAPVTGFDSGPCLRFAAQGQFHPLEYLNGLATAVQRRGGQIHSESAAREVIGGERACVRTAAGHAVRAASIVIATNSPFNDLVAIHTKQAPYHTYAVGARVKPGTVTPALYWDTEDPYHYVRLHRTSNAELGGDNSEPVDILIVGGEDHKAGQAQDADARFAALESWMRERFPSAGTVEFRWSGQVMETVDGLGYIGRNPLDADNVYVITGDSGMGMTHGTIGGMLIADLILRRENPWTELYDPARVRTGAVVEWVKENLNVALQYKAWLTPGDVPSVDQITPNNGAVIVESGRKLAVYRDERGTLHRRSAVCPHLGCIVAWNPAASSWDCPCHGSRFDKFGGVFNGPSPRDLDPA
ncbi:MAG TPA: FAD-dependent oxidoreductase [Vicinamibacterales bacterium]|nr:FAD-dependent oxidoreductase [Vicinamibacterales bacterium]